MAVVFAESLWLWHRFEFASAAFKKAEIPPHADANTDSKVELGVFILKNRLVVVQPRWVRN